jgi:hypothetical protein
MMLCRGVKKVYIYIIVTLTPSLSLIRERGAGADFIHRLK